jgi:uncharacterized protein YutE (UPF0331/DUF86 family)
MVDEGILARRVAAIRDAVARVREFLPEDPAALDRDRTAREVVVLNLFVALQEALTLASHWLADEGWEPPGAYGEMFLTLASHGVIEQALGERLAGAAGLRNLIAHRYAALDTKRIHTIARDDIDDLLRFCAALAQAANR